MKTITIRGVDPILAKVLQKRALENGESANMVILKILRKELGLYQQSIFKTYFDLDHLAGTWDKKHASEFEKNIEPLSKIDPEMWT